MGAIGKVNVCLDQAWYVAGDEVTGVVYLELLEDGVDVDLVYVKVKGKEKVVWREEWTTPRFAEVEGERQVVGHDDHEADFDEKEAFFKHKVRLVPHEDMVLGAGKHAFPFAFQLPKEGKKGGRLAGCFEMKGNAGVGGDSTFGWRGVRGAPKHLKAKVEYSIKAVVDLDDHKDIEKKIDFVVYPEPPTAIPTPSDAKTASVLLCCCINRGDLTMEATLDKNVYAPGEMAQATLVVQNRSSLEVTAMVELNRIVRLKADGHHIRASSEQHLGSFDVIAPGESKTVHMQFRIPDTMPTTAARYVDCSYVLDIVSELGCAPDIELHFPIHIFARPIQWQESMPDATDYIVAGAGVVESMPLKPGYASCEAVPVAECSAA